MSDLYSELLVKRKPSLKDGLIRSALLGLTTAAVIMVLLSLLNPIILLVALVLALVDYFVIPKLNVEFEYLHINDEIDVDKIFSKQKRKRVMNIDLNQVEMVAPLGSHHLDSYQNLKTIDYSANDREQRPYVLVTSKNNTQVKVLLQLDQAMFQNIKRRMPRTAFDD